MFKQLEKQYIEAVKSTGVLFGDEHGFAAMYSAALCQFHRQRLLWTHILINRRDLWKGATPAARWLVEQLEPTVDKGLDDFERLAGEISSFIETIDEYAERVAGVSESSEAVTH